MTFSEVPNESMKTGINIGALDASGTSFRDSRMLALTCGKSQAIA